MLKIKVVISMAIAIFFAGNLLFGQARSSESEDILIKAQYKERLKENLWLATGNVEIHYKDIKIFADRAELNTETKDIYVSGNVTILFPDESISSDEAHLNMDSSEGELKKVFGILQPTIRYEAETIKRQNDRTYSFDKANITSCTQPVPRWKFSFSRANFEKDDHIEMWNSVFSIKKVPIFYLPYLRYPLKDRSTGFLMPQLGFSGPKGFSYGQSFYWVMKRNMDATFSADFYGARGLGAGMEYRYLLSRGVGGQLNLYYFKYKEGDPGNAYLFRFKHNQTLPLNFNLVANIDYSSSFDFLREFDNDFRRAVVSNRRSELYLFKAWSYFNLNMRLARFETYFRESGSSIVTYNLPSIGFSSSKIKLFSPLYFSFASSFSRWEYGWDYEYEEDRQRRSQTLGFIPQLTVPFTALPWVTVDTSLSSNLSYYFQTYDPATGEIVDEPLFSQNYAADIKLVGPVFYKIYYGKQGEAKLKHIIEPNLSYRYESPVQDSDRIITARYFYRDHYIRYGLTNRLLKKTEQMPREILSFGLSQTFYFSPEDSPLNIFRVDGKIPEFSDIEAYLRYYPVGRYSLDVSAAYNPYYDTFSRLRVGASVGSQEDNAFLKVNWYKSINPYRYETWWDRHQVGFYGGLKIPRLSLELQAEADFNIKEKEMLYNGFIFIYHYQCIDFRGELKIFYFRDRPEAQFRITFGLGNIGRTTDFLGGMGF